MIKKLCIFTINFAFNRQIMLDFLSKIIPQEVELFLFVPKECKGKFSSKRIIIHESKKNKYACFIDFRKFCKKNKIDKIFSLGALPQEGFLMAFASGLTSTKSLCHLVVNPYMAYKTGFNKPAIKAFFEFLLLHPMLIFIDKFYISTKDMYEKSRNTFFYLRKKLDFLKYPTDTDFFIIKNKDKCRKFLNLPSNKKIILYVGRIEYEKGSDILLKLAKLNKDTLFLLIGQLFDDNLKNININNLKVISPQTRESLIDYYNSADLCVFPSRSEAGPSAARESMSCGVQVILPDMIGPRMLSPPAIKSRLNVKELNEKIINFFNLSKRERIKLTKELRLFIKREYSEESLKKDYIDKLIGNL